MTETQSANHSGAVWNQLSTLARKQQTTLLQRDPRLKHSFLTFHVNGQDLDFLSIRAFKDSRVYASDDTPQLRYRSSGTTDSSKSIVLLDQAAVKESSVHSQKGFAQTLQRLGIQDQSDLVLNSFVPSPLVWTESSLAAMIWGFEVKELNLLDPLTAKDFKSFRAKSNTIDAVKKTTLVFGTSLHHLQFLSRKFSNKIQCETKAEHLIVFDTGGTKTKTTDLSPEQMYNLLAEGYAPFCDKLTVCSEFGMCELSNQAYATKDLRTFQCNEGLVPFVFNPRSLCLANEHETGVLGFGDLSNTSTYCLILTEDLAVSLNDSIFRWVGRAPDASVKGCSLNVSADFSFNAPLTKLVAACQKNETALEVDLCQHNLLFENDFKHSLEEVKKHLPELKSLRVNSIKSKKRELTLVASGNAAVSIIYPLAWAFGYGAQSVTLKIPSIRSQDFLSNAMRSSLIAIIKLLSDLLEDMNIKIVNDITALTESQGVLVFGSDETIGVIRKNIADGAVYKHLPFVGFGHHTNAQILRNVAEARDAARAAAQFLGRGCLAPVALFVSSESIFEEFCQEFFEGYSHREKELEHLKLFSHATTSHLHLICQLETILNTCIPKRQSLSSQAIVLDFRNFESISISAISFLKAGGGVVFVFNEKHLALFTQSLSFDNPFPDLHSSHNGRQWSDVMTNLLH